ncbi:MAG: bifunctional phosphoribosylaminoimidazolecarboxamide formyltransferase/IMP cyclohydrolase [Bacteroidales bacterium]|nr:bifunctional phosphoribosylaminoimidazolecarboxamide formyltransferase/IMP cyclohydrolase [Bacteroidales bacterium]
MKKIKSALISVYYKDGLKPVVERLNELGVKIFSTGGTQQFLEECGVTVTGIDELTGYPSILGGRVKTLHPKVFGGILARRSHESDLQQLAEYAIPELDLVIVDLYPFEETLRHTGDEKEIIEKIDIGGISLIRAAAKNFNDVLIVPSRGLYSNLLALLEEKNGESSLEDRRHFAALAFNVSSHYDTAIFNYFNADKGVDAFKLSVQTKNIMRYGENPHQQGIFYGQLDEVFTQLHGKAISYNNLVDLDAAIALIQEFTEPTFAILKHTNACGVATRETLLEAWNDALAGDQISAFGGVIITNRVIDESTAREMDHLFFEIVLAPGFEDNALEILKSRKNRIILQQKSFDFQAEQFRSVMNGVLWQNKDLKQESRENLKVMTNRQPSDEELADLLWANHLVKHTKSNAIVLAKNRQLLGSGTGQTSRVDALKQAIEKAVHFGFDLNGAVMASDAFFPFADSVELAYKAGIRAVIQPGGSVRDQETIDFCNANEVAMVFTGIRHFKH